MWIKLLGGGMILFSAPLLGQLWARRLSVREKSLRGFLNAFSMLEGEISFSGKHLSDAFLQIGRICGMKIFSDTAKSIPEYGFSKSWETALSSYQKSLCLTGEDLEILMILSEQLGKSDRDNQIRHLHHVSTLTQNQLRNAADQKKTLSGLYRGMGVLCGFFLMLMLL